MGKPNANPTVQTTPTTRTSEERPPPYSSSIASPSQSSSSATVQQSRTNSFTPGIPNLDFSKCAIPDSEVSQDGTEVITRNPTLNTNAAALTRFIRDQCSIPPIPYIRIVGTSFATDRFNQHFLDFDVKLNMLRYILPSQARPESSNDFGNAGEWWNYVKLAGEGEMAFRGRNEQTMSPALKGLEQWAIRFCNETVALKSFTVNRQITNWNTTFLEGQIRSLIAATGYTGHVSVSFPVKYGKITIQPARGGIDGFFTTIFSPLMDKKRYEVLSAVWPYASLAPGVEASVAGRVCAVKTEEAWWEEWKDVIRVAVVEKRKGWVSVDDLLMAKMVPGKVEPVAPSWGC